MGTRTSGSAGGGGQTTARKRGTAARLRPTIETVRRISPNVKHWSSGDMCLRWTAAGMLEAQGQLRRIIGYPDLAKLALAVERVAPPSAADTSTTTHATVATTAPEVTATPA